MIANHATTHGNERQQQAATKENKRPKSKGWKALRKMRSRALLKQQAKNKKRGYTGPELTVRKMKGLLTLRGITNVTEDAEYKTNAQIIANWEKHKNDEIRRRPARIPKHLKEWEDNYQKRKKDMNNMKKLYL